MIRSRIKRKYTKWSSRENFLALKQIKKKFTNLIKTAKKQYFGRSAENQRLSNKSFWNSVLLFLTNKNVDDEYKIRNDDVITLKEKELLVNDELEVAEALNSHYINIVKIICGQPPQTLGNPKEQVNDIALVNAIISNYKNHPSINQIRIKCPIPKKCSFPDAKKDETNILIKRLNPKKTIRPDEISLKIIKLSAAVIDKHLTDIAARSLVFKRLIPCEFLVVSKCYTFLEFPMSEEQKKHTAQFFSDSCTFYRPE